MSVSWWILTSSPPSSTRVQLPDAGPVRLLLPFASLGFMCPRKSARCLHVKHTTPHSVKWKMSSSSVHAFSYICFKVIAFWVRLSGDDINNNKEEKIQCILSSVSSKANLYLAGDMRMASACMKWYTPDGLSNTLIYSRKEDQMIIIRLFFKHIFKFPC